MNIPTREQALSLARSAASRATVLAGHAETAAHNPDKQNKVHTFAAAGAVWADVARAHAAIAQAVAETEDADV